MTRHVRIADVAPPPDPFVPANPGAFWKLPEPIQTALNRFHGDVERLETALLDALRIYTAREQQALRVQIFNVLGLRPITPVSVQTSRQAG